jgi:hypothetical protein
VILCEPVGGVGPVKCGLSRQGGGEGHETLSGRDSGSMHEMRKLVDEADRMYGKNREASLTFTVRDFRCA